MSMILMRTCSPSCVSGIYKAVSYVFFFLLNVALSPMRISSRALGPGFMKWQERVMFSMRAVLPCVFPQRFFPIADMFALVVLYIL